MYLSLAGVVLIVLRPHTNLLICSLRNTFYGRAWNLDVLFADQSSQVGSVIFVKAKSVRRVLSQKMSLVIILLQNVLHAIEEK
jgi:hypothetical protein